MKNESIALYAPGEYSYPMSFGFMPNLKLFLHEGEAARPLVIVVPGGAYRYCSPSEGEPIRNRFYEMGFQTGILTYTTNPVMNAPLGRQASLDLARALRTVRQRAADYHVDPEKVAICGCSAGGHLCADLSTHFAEYGGREVRPDAVVLCYPVITMGEATHRESREALLGASPKPEDIRYFSEETQVGRETPPTLIWTTAADELVPPENTFLYERALAAAGVPHAMHLFSQGEHGLSAANAHWASGSFRTDSLDQTRRVRDQVMAGNVPDIAQEKILAYLNSCVDEDRSGREVNEEVAEWMEMAQRFLQQQGFQSR